VGQTGARSGGSRQATRRRRRRATVGRVECKAFPKLERLGKTGMGGLDGGREAWRASERKPQDVKC
jgi:hypothetical protein